MRRKKRWTDAEVQKLISMVGNRSLGQIAQELERPRGSVSTKARELGLSLVVRRESASIARRRSRQATPKGRQHDATRT
jgi:hypothetical protein